MRCRKTYKGFLPLHTLKPRNYSIFYSSIILISISLRYLFNQEYIANREPDVGLFISPGNTFLDSENRRNCKSKTLYRIRTDGIREVLILN